MTVLKLFAHGKSKPGHEKELRALVQELLFAGRREQAEFGDVEVYEAYETETPGEFIFQRSTPRKRPSTGTHICLIT